MTSKLEESSKLQVYLIWRGSRYSPEQVATLPGNTLDAEWRIDPDGLSTFENPPGTPHPYALGFSLLLPGKKHEGIEATILDEDLTEAGFVARYTPEHGDGHWSVYSILGLSKTQSKRAISRYARKNAFVAREDIPNQSIP